MPDRVWPCEPLAMSPSWLVAIMWCSPFTNEMPCHFSSTWRDMHAGRHHAWLIFMRIGRSKNSNKSLIKGGPGSLNLEMITS